MPLKGDVVLQQIRVCLSTLHINPILNFLAYLNPRVVYWKWMLYLSLYTVANVVA